MNNVFPFIFGLVSKEELKCVVEKAKALFIKKKKHPMLQDVVFYCLFEAQDKSLCTEFAEVFGIANPLNIMPNTLLQYHHAFYFLSICNLPQLNIICSSVLTNIHIEVMAKYFNNSFTDIISFCSDVSLDTTGFAGLCKILSCHDLLSLQLASKSREVHPPGCVSVLCDSISQHHPNITILKLPPAKLCKQDLDSLGNAIATLESLESLDMVGCTCYDGTSLKLSITFCNALRNAKCLDSYIFGGCQFSVDDFEMFSDIISQNTSIQELKAAHVYNGYVIASTLQGLSTNQTITSFTAWPGPYDTSHTLGQYLGKCLASNQALTVIDFTSSVCEYPWSNLQWSSEHVCCIFTGLQSNHTLVSLDISGCYIDKAASNAICAMLSVNTSLKHLFLNPVHLEKLEAIAIFNSCINNAILEVLTLLHLPGGELAHAPWSSLELMKSQPPEQPMWCTDSIYPFAEDSEIIDILRKVQRCREDTKQSSFTVLW